MRVSIITPTYNSSQTLGDTLASVQKQTYGNIEHVFIDNLSTDETVQMIKKYQDSTTNLVKLHSQSDLGIYDATNNGVKIATGDIVAVLNSDDFYISPNLIQEVVDTFEKTNCDVCYGDIVIVDRNDTNKIKRKWKSGQFSKKNIFRGWCPPHPAFFYKRDLHNKYGYYSTNFSIASDYDFMIRLIKSDDTKMKYIPKVFTIMRHKGHSSKSFSQRIKGWQELRQSWKNNYGKVPAFFITKRVLLKIRQIF